MTGRFWAADIGQDDWEEINVVEPGGDYGWRTMEGRHCFMPRTGCATEGLVEPVAEYRYEGARCSIIGGYVYRGADIPALVGYYL